MRRVRGRPASNSREFDGADELLDLLEKVEALRERLRLFDRKLSHLLATGMLGDYPDEERPVDINALQRHWRDFIAAGGVSADDLRAFIRGECIGAAAPVKKHLRLVSKQPRPVLRRRILYRGGGNDAA